MGLVSVNGTKEAVNTGGTIFLTDITNSETPVTIGESVAAGSVFGGAGTGSVTFTAISANEKILLEAPEIDAKLAGLSIGLLSGILFLFAERRRATTI